MLTIAVPSPKYDADLALLDLLGLRPRPAFKDDSQVAYASADSDKP
jgi:hypothetical protein